MTFAIAILMYRTLTPGAISNSISSSPTEVTVPNNPAVVMTSEPTCTELATERASSVRRREGLMIRK